MSTKRLSTLYRILMILTAFAMVAFVLPKTVQAASPFITITGVKADQSVTVKATGLPVGYTFTARMDVVSSQAVNGTIVGETKSGSDGTFEATYAIPSALKGKSALSIRIDSTKGGFYAYNWFNNKTQGTSGTITPAPTTTPAPTSGSSKMFIKVIAVEQNKRITVSADGFPLNTDFKVRVGPFYTFGTQQVNLGTVNSGKTGSFRFNLDLPSVVKDIEMVTIRLDSATKQYSYNVFTNKNQGTVDKDPSKSIPVTGGTPTTTPTVTPVTYGDCQIISVVPTTSMKTSADFDAIWTIKNISSRTWNNHEIDYRYLSGTKMHKYTQPYDLPAMVKPGETVKLLVDMVAPNKTGTYTTEFELRGDLGRLCSLPLTVVIK